MGQQSSFSNFKLYILHNKILLNMKNTILSLVLLIVVLSGCSSSEDSNPVICKVSSTESINGRGRYNSNFIYNSQNQLTSTNNINSQLNIFNSNDSIISGYPNEPIRDRMFLNNGRWTKSNNWFNYFRGDTLITQSKIIIPTYNNNLVTSLSIILKEEKVLGAFRKISILDSSGFSFTYNNLGDIITMSKIWPNGSINYLVSYPTNTGSINSNYSLNNYLIYNVGLQSLFLPIITGNFVPFKHVPSSISYTNITMGATFTGSLTSSSVLPDGNNNISRIIISGGGSLQNYNDTLSFNYQCR